MFKDKILETPFTTGYAGTYFTNIVGDSFEGDCSFLASLRALLGARGGGEYVTLKFYDLKLYNIDSILQCSTPYALSKLCDERNIDLGGYLVIHNLCNVEQSNAKIMEFLEENFAKTYKGFQRVEKVEAFYRGSCKVLCYINPKKKSTAVFAENLDFSRLHYLEVSIPVFLPWYFKPEDGLTADELALIQSLRKADSKDYMACLSRMSEGYDFRSESIRKLLGGFESKQYEDQCDDIRAKIRDIDASNRVLADSIGENLKKREAACIELLGLENKIASSSGSEIMEYFLCNSQLELEGVIGTNIYFAVKTYLEYFDMEMAEKVISNKSSYIYTQLDTDEEIDDTEMLLDEIFVSETPRLRVRVCGAYSLSAPGCVGPCSSHSFSPEFENYMRNPHIDTFECMGDYTRIIVEILQNSDYIGAIEQCIASCKSLNFGDSAVMREFMKKLWVQNDRCIELPGGKVVPRGEAVEWLKEQDGTI